MIDELKEQVNGLVIAVKEATAHNKGLIMENTDLRGQVYHINKFIKDKFPELVMSTDTFGNVKNMAISMSQKFMLVMSCNDKAVKDLAKEVEEMRDANSR